MPAALGHVVDRLIAPGGEGGAGGDEGQQAEKDHRHRFHRVPLMVARGLRIQV